MITFFHRLTFTNVDDDWREPHLFTDDLQAQAVLTAAGHLGLGG